MTPDDTLERHLIDSMASVAKSGAPDYLDHILGRSIRTRQRHVRLPWQRSAFPTGAPHLYGGWWTRRSLMTPILGVSAAVLLVAAFGAWFGPHDPSTQNGAQDPTPSARASPSPSAAPLHDGPLAPGTYVTTPFAAPGSDGCGEPSDPICDEAIADDTIGVTFTVPEGWSGRDASINLTTGFGQTLDGAAMIFNRGGSLYNDPCRPDGAPQIPVGLTAAEFADALAAHPLLDVTTPVEVTIGGYPGWYAELQVPDDPTIQGSNDGASLPGCPIYQPWFPWYFARMGGERWLLWIVDANDHRVVVQGMVHPETTDEAEEQLRAIVESMEIVPSSDVRAWPATNGSRNPAGTYSWTPGTSSSDCTRHDSCSWMHNYNESGNVEIIFGTWDGDTGSSIQTESGGDQDMEAMRTLVTAAGYDDRTFLERPVRVPDDRPVGSAESRTQLWLLDVEDARFFMLIVATGGTAADEAEAVKIIESVRVGPPSLGPGIVLTFELPPGWDSG